MNKADSKKKDMAKKMGINMGSASEAASHIPNYLKRGNKLDNVGKNATNKSSVTDPGKNNQSSRKNP